MLQRSSETFVASAMCWQPGSPRSKPCSRSRWRLIGLPKRSAPRRPRYSRRRTLPPPNAERAEREAEAIRAEALAAADTTRAEAIAAREETLATAERDAEEVAEEGRQRGRDMVNEAQAVRERMLSDLARKRQTGRAQVEQLRAGRDRLLESLTIAQQSLDAAMKDLVDSVPEAALRRNAPACGSRTSPRRQWRPWRPRSRRPGWSGIRWSMGSLRLVLLAISMMSLIRRSSRPRWKR